MRVISARGVLRMPSMNSIISEWVFIRVLAYDCASKGGECLLQFLLIYISMPKVKLINFFQRLEFHFLPFERFSVEPPKY